ncbi:MAG: arylsulfatase [Sporocytophaga sp.]|uniref:arylsulfatase n=1 Tax=Sporocytophaga sp. TaxID=2231183 RepID=UPI001B017807|nr:arylsulfatase [Sporocytophaga sp.]MBO9701018.1 arylsulfatase [Sporocytophaga sp.]
MKRKNPNLNRYQLPIPRISPKTVTPFDIRNAAKPEPIEELRPPKDAPNILIVLIDDMGFGATSAFGGPCYMPNAERLANNGLKYNRFHTTALCSPTRAALLSGRNHHSVNMAGITECATPNPGYNTIRPESMATIAQTLVMNGYNTAAFGKMHQTPVWETSIAGPFDRWPTGEGFEKFYGFIGGETNQWAPSLIAGTIPIDSPNDPEYHFSSDITDKAISYIRQQKTMAPDKPFFAYLAFGATHAPHHAPKEYIEKYKGQFDHGWDRQREITLDSQKVLGIVPQNCELSSRPNDIPAWDSLNDKEKLAASRLMEAYAGFAEHTDHQVGRVLSTLEEIEALDNTLIFYILGDNGASGEGGIYGSVNEIAALNNAADTTENIINNLDAIGTPMAYNHYPVGWAHAMDTPYQWTKQIASHWGGTRTGMITHWPNGIASKNEVRHQWCHVIDIVPTILEAAKIPHPQFVNGIQQEPIEGISFVYTFDDPNAPERHTTQYFEIGGNRGIYHEGWSACTIHSVPWVLAGVNKPFADDIWELYAPGDWSQAHNIAFQNPQKLKELQDLFLIEASKYKVFPLDDRKAERFNSDLAGRPDLLQGRTTMTLYPGMSHLNENTVLNIKNKSFSVTAEVEIKDDMTNGVIIAQGGRFAGWSLYMKNGYPVFCYNWFNRQHYYIGSREQLNAGKHFIHFEFIYDGGGIGKGGTGILYADDHEIGQGRIDNTVPFLFSADDFMDIGKDSGAPVTDDYASYQAVFTGTINWVKINIGSEVNDDPAGKEHAYLVRQ